ncbi:hypothetical protein [Streptomyces sp. cmx-4-9]|uniref:hypothetical protein n=1 Tax=Streptomyces sp. cmx-4-9 TaxID=2790941 RepID=UPI00397F3BD1
MTRTARHLPSPHHRTGPDSLPGSPWHSVVLHDLRYSTQCFTQAARESTRPVPRPVRRTVVVHSFARYRQDRSIVPMSAGEERRARQRLRAQVGLLLRLVNSSTGQLALDAADAVDLPPARHRRSSLWLA